MKNLKDKILLNIDTWFFHFGIAKILQDKYDCELYAIIDVDSKARQFFENQQFVKFKKVWYYTDCMSKVKKKPDLNYLQEFEEKYKINLWSVAYTDRDFYRYNNYYTFSDDEILSILEQECRLYEEILDEIKPDFLSTYMSISHYQHLLHLLCKSKSIKTLMLGPVRFGHRMMISQDGLKIDKIDELETNNTKDTSFQKIQDYLRTFDAYKQILEVKKTSFESNTWKRYKSIIKFFISSEMINQNRYSDYGRSRSKIFIQKITRMIKRKYRESFINKNFTREIANEKKFVYFPLHYEPERVLLIDAPYHDNQLSVISNIAKSLPIEFHLCVKEHPLMKTLGWRDISFYKQIMKLPNVRLIHPSITPAEILQKCSLVVTIAGTTGLEAAFYKKPTVLFTDQLYSYLPFVHKIDKIEELPIIIKKYLKKNVNTDELGKFIELIETNSFELDINKMSADFAYEFGFKGPVMDAEIPNEKVKLFLEKYNSIFEKLTAEHIKKIKKYKNDLQRRNNETK